MNHQIHTKNDIPVYTKNYRYPYIHKQEVQEQISKMLEQGIIRPSYSPWNSPIWIVPKKLDASGKQKWRLVIDYRKLNEQTIDDKYPLPNISEILDKLGRCMYFTSIDLASGFHQIEVDPKDIQKTAFSVDNGHYEYVRMPFGLKNAPSSFQRVMDNVLRDLIGKDCLVYIDDIVVYSVSLQEHLEKLTRVFNKLRQANLKIQLDKSHFMAKEIEFLGHIVSSEGIKPNPNKISAIKNYPLPKTTKEIKGFLGLLGYYRKFIHNLAKITKPLTSKLKKGAVIDFQPDYIQAFEKCKQLLMNDPILQYPDFSKTFNLTTDASNHSIGAVLSQGSIGNDKPVCYASRTLNKTEQNYSTTEKELLAIVWSMQYFRPYLYGRKFNLLTDHQPLQNIYKMKNTNNKLMRMKDIIDGYEFTPMYIKGKANVVADALSRIPEIHINENNSTSSNQTQHSADEDNSDLIPISEKSLNEFTEQVILKTDDKNDTPKRVLKVLFKTKHRQIFSCKNFTKQNLIDILKQYFSPKKTIGIHCSDEILKLVEEIYTQFFSTRKSFKLVRCKILLDDIENEDLQDHIIKQQHDNHNHRGINEVNLEIKRNSYFPHLKEKITKYINNCEICQTQKYDRQPIKPKFELTETAKKPLDIVHTDIFHIQSQNIITIIDKFSKYANAFILESKNSIDVIKSLRKFFSIHGIPRKLICDPGLEFSSMIFTDFLKQFKIEVHYTSTDNSTGNSPIERFHSTLAEHYRILYDQDKNRLPQDLLDESILHYNNSIHSTTKFKPFELFTGRTYDFDKDITPNNYHEYLKTYNKHQKELFKRQEQKEAQLKAKRLDKLNSNRTDPPDIEPGENVFRKGLKYNKLNPKFRKSLVAENQHITVRLANNTKVHKSKIKKKRSFQITRPPNKNILPEDRNNRPDEHPRDGPNEAGPSKTS